MKSSDFPKQADIVIIGVGGIVGSMLAYWLAELKRQRAIIDDGDFPFKMRMVGLIFGGKNINYYAPRLLVDSGY